MKLEEFVKQTLVDITNGVVGARQTAALWIAPGYVEGKAMTDPEHVAFEVAVTINKEGGAGIEVLAFSVDGNVKSEHINKISFRVPVYFNAPTKIDK